MLDGALGGFDRRGERCVAQRMEETEMGLPLESSSRILGDARRAWRYYAVGAWVALAGIALAVWGFPANATTGPFGQAVVDAAMNEPAEQYAPNLACPGPSY